MDLLREVGIPVLQLNQVVPAQISTRVFTRGMTKNSLERELQYRFVQIFAGF